MKVVPPLPPSGEVDRSHLLLAAIGSDTVSIVSVTAPAGSGKTVLLTQTTRALRDTMPIAWVTLDEADNDPVLFWGYVRLALGDLATAEPGADPDPPAGDRGISASTAAVSRLLSDLGTPALLVLDDFHSITNGEIHRGIDRLVGLLPRGVTLVLASRTPPPLPTARWLIEGRLVEVHGTDLAFSESDAVSFLHDGLGLELAGAALAGLVQRTRGWAAGLRVAGLSLRHAADATAFVDRFAGDHHHLVSYFGSEVLDRQPPESRAFLLDTSVLDELTADACEAVIGSADAAGLLRRLASTGVFVDPLDDSRSRFACHPLFREMLLSRLRSERPADVARLHRRAARWFGQTGEVERQIDHLIRAGDHDDAYQVILGNWVRLSNGGRHGLVWRWVEQLPPLVARRDPRLSVMAAWTRLNERDYDDVERWLSYLEPLLSDDGLRCEAAVIRSHRWRHLGDALQSARAATEAVLVAPAEDHLRQSMARAASGAALYWLGQFEEARSELERAVEHGRRCGECSSVVLGLMYQACLEGPDAPGSPGPAELAAQALEVAAESADFHVPAMAHLVLATCALADHRLRAALEAIDEAERLAELGQEPLELTMVSALRARVLHLRGDTSAARVELRLAGERLAELAEPGITEDAVRRAGADIRFAPRQASRGGLPVQPLTERELTVVRALDSDLTRQQIADELYVSLATVKTHLHSVARKLGVSARADIVARARTLGLLPDEP